MHLNKEAKMVRLVETCGVATSPWKSEIDAIFRYVGDYVKRSIEKASDTKKMDFYVPYEISNVFPFLGDPYIHIIAEMSDDETGKASGRFEPRKYIDFSPSLKRMIDDGKIEYDENTQRIYHGEITIYCFYNKYGKVYFGHALGSLYHELNHAYDMWIDANTTGGFDRYSRTSRKSYFGNKLSRKFPYIGECIYRLFSETEYNALVASVFGDLDDLKSTLPTFSQDYKLTQAYEIYDILKNNLESEIQSISDKDCYDIYKEMQNVGITLNVFRYSPDAFKRAFIRKAEIKLNDLIRDIGKTGMFYNNLKYNESLKDPVWLTTILNETRIIK